MVKFRVVHIVIIYVAFALSIYAQDFTSNYDADENCTPATFEFALDTLTVLTDTIDSLSWSFGSDPADTLIRGPLDTVSFQFTEPGAFTVTMLVNDSINPMVTKDDYITIEQRLNANFESHNIDSNLYRFVPTDIIIDSSQTFFYSWTYTNTVTNRSENGKLAEIDDGDITQAIDTFAFDPGNHEIRLLIDHLNGCDVSLSTKTIDIETSQIPQTQVEALYFNTDTTEGCTPLEVRYIIRASNLAMDTVTSIEWDFGIGKHVNTLVTDTTIIYTEPGTYDVSMIINDDDDNEYVITDYITAHQTVSAAFQVDEYAENNNFKFIPIDIISDSSMIYSYTWSKTLYDSSDTRITVDTVIEGDLSDANDLVTLADGTYIINLSVQDAVNGCQSTYSKMLYAYPEINAPNIFFPGEGEYYIIDPQNINTVLHFEVFNRYGLPIYSQIAPIIHWDGRSINGTFLTTGVYFYTLEATQGDPLNKYVQKGFIHIYY